MLDPRHAARAGGAVRWSVAVLLRRLVFLAEQACGQGVIAIPLGERAVAPARRGFLRIRSAVVQELLRFRYLAKGRAAVRHSLQLSAARRRAADHHRIPGAAGYRDADLQSVATYDHGRKGLWGERADRQSGQMGAERAGRLAADLTAPPGHRLGGTSV